jgi:hypothetical protein
MSREQSGNDKAENARLVDLALSEFKRFGEVRNVRCPTCRELIKLKALSPAAWEIKCSCGRFWGSMVEN